MPGLFPHVGDIDLTQALDRSRQWWRRYASDLPMIDLPDERLMRIYDYCVIKFAGLTHPCGTAVTLQGPWTEEYQLSPWSNDYHFNIDLQMCYWPALSLGRTNHLKPLWAMIQKWFPTLLETGGQFFDAHGDMMLPQATDDRCQAIGTFWQGTIDHASTA